MQPMHLETWESEDFDLAGSIYIDPERQISLWVKVGIAVMEIPLELVDDVCELIKSLGVAAAHYLEETDNVN